MNKKPVKRVNSKEESKFKTDKDISKTQFKERELTRWVPEDDEVLPQALQLEDNSSGKKWDQFKVNEEKFGVEASFDEHLYTTRINTDAHDYQERLREAEKLAMEIEQDANGDSHILEERGKVDDSGLDEEMKYSGVYRDEDIVPGEAKKDTRGDELMAALKSMNVKSPSPSNSNSKDLGPEIINNDPSIASIDKKHNASFRLNAQSEINSLKEFSATFKVPHKLPNDLLPILAKDKSKQDEILKKSTSSQESSSSSTPQHQHQTSEPQKPKRTESKFKLNPKAATFTPAAAAAASFVPATAAASTSFTPAAPSFTPRSNQISPQPPAPPKLFNGSSNRSPNNPSPRMNHQRPYSSGSSNSSKRHYQISPADFFGPNQVPTRESQAEKTTKLKKSFSIFMTVKASTKKDDPIQVERAYITPPTWDQTINEPHMALFPPPEKAPMAPPFMMGMPPQMGMPPSPFSPQSSDGSPIPSPMAMPSSPSFQQQQQFQAMMYQQQFGMPGAMPSMYMPPTDYAPNYGYRGGYYNNNGRRYSKRNSNYGQ